MLVIQVLFWLLHWNCLVYSEEMTHVDGKLCEIRTRASCTVCRNLHSTTWHKVRAVINVCGLTEWYLFFLPAVFSTSFSFTLGHSCPPWFSGTPLSLSSYCFPGHFLYFLYRINKNLTFFLNFMFYYFFLHTPVYSLKLFVVLKFILL